MLPKRQYFFLFTLFFLHGIVSKAQLGPAVNPTIYSTDDNTTVGDTTEQYTLHQILISGNNRTRASIILREVPFAEGDQLTLSELVRKFGETKRQLMNTGLFSEVIVSLKNMQGKDAVVAIQVKERGYVYPIPFARIVDRNFNDWQQQGMKLSRVNYGIKITHRNTTGRNDRLYIYVTNGYTKQLALRYDGLYLDKDLQWSTNFSVALGKDREQVYATKDNKLLFYKSDDQYVNSFVRSAIEFSYRRAIKTKHTFGIGYNYENIKDTVFHLNPSFSGQTKAVHYPELYYKLTYFNVDFNPYPTKGYLGELTLLKRGFNPQINLWQFTAKGSGSWPVLQNKYFINLRAVGSIKLPFKQTYVTDRLLGYDGMLMQGYEYYVIDGVAGGYGKLSLNRQIFDRVFHLPVVKKLEKYNTVPVKVYAKVYTNAGYVYNPRPGDNFLCNRFLYSSGVGLDFVVLTDFIIKLEWSFNRLGENGLYLHRKDYF